ncbi:hypothetical protein SAMN02745248_02712 [Hathewaya proteolytica DSM 3090]|uniref:Uncharacterized protein n=1 Tax=Hathewaya proteolytica DSM 3090 TaxID=1121331 RepID=A0A1M6T2Y5_9CLOT|nr:hypothetical protein [Hathewaya proteolytica]SHK51362.1 hypothetical protein SAMN02745248_02712 [Hathewaya proteolytica DSM 3090]
MKNFTQNNVDLIIHKDFSDIISYRTTSLNILVNIIDKSSKKNLVTESLSSLELIKQIELKGSKGLRMTSPVLRDGYLNINVNFDHTLIEKNRQEMSITLEVKNTFIKKHISFTYTKI